MKFNKITQLAFAAALFMGTSSAFGITQFLTTSGQVLTDPSGIRVQMDQFRSGGTGNLDPFLRIQANDTESGFNTSAANPPLDAKPGPWTHDLLFSTLQIVQFQGNSYYQISLDINQTQSLPQEIVLTGFDLYTGNIANATTLAGMTLVVSMVDDFNISTLNAGSGVGDVQFYIPIEYFAGNTDLYLTLMATFTGSNDGFEEFSAVTGPNGTAVPEGGATLMLLGASLGALAIGRRFLVKRSSVV